MKVGDKVSLIQDVKLEYAGGAVWTYLRRDQVFTISDFTLDGGVWVYYEDDMQTFCFQNRCLLKVID